MGIQDRDYYLRDRERREREARDKRGTHKQAATPATAKGSRFGLAALVGVWGVIGLAVFALVKAMGL